MGERPVSPQLVARQIVDMRRRHDLYVTYIEALERRIAEASELLEQLKSTSSRPPTGQ